MANASTMGGGELRLIDAIVLNVPGCGPIKFYAMPTVTDKKGAKYSDEALIGRATPLTTYAYSEIRSITVDIPFIVRKPSDIQTNLSQLRCIESVAYPRAGGEGTPFKPPPICTFKFGDFIATVPLCVILMSYQVKNDPQVPVDATTMVPYKFSVSTTWNVVYRSNNLPGNQRIIDTGF
jgi:hypothetical protein